MRKSTLMVVSAACMLFVSCIDDDGNYDYITLSDVEIGGLQESYRFILQSPVSLSPVIRTDIPQDRLEYCWRIDADTLVTTRVLDYTFSRVPVGNSPLTFEVYDRQTDIRYIRKMGLNVVSPFSTGWLVLTDIDGRSVLGFQSYEADNSYYSDVYREVNGRDMTGRPVAVKQLVYNYSGEDRVVVVNENGLTPDLDGVSLIELVTFESQFGGDVRPSLVNVSTEYYTTSNAVTVVSSDGMIYGKSIGYSGTPEDGGFEYPFQGDEKGYGMSPYLVGIQPGYPTHLLGFDERNNRFVSFMASRMSSTVDPVVWDAEASIRNVDLENIPGKLVWIGLLNDSKVCAVINDDGVYTMYCFKVSYTLSCTLTACVSLPAGVVDANSCFERHPVSPYLFITTGNRLMAVNFENLNDIQGAVNDIATYEGDVTAMHYAYNAGTGVDEFGIAIRSGLDKSSLLIIDPSLTAHGRILTRYDGIDGRIVSICRKIK